MQQTDPQGGIGPAATLDVESSQEPVLLPPTSAKEPHLGGSARRALGVWRSHRDATATAFGERTGPWRALLGRAGRHPYAPQFLLCAFVFWYAARFSSLVLRRHNQFGSFDYDLGIYDQGIWLLGHGRQLLTVRGLRYLGHHWNPATLLYVPFYRLGAGPNLLNVSQAFAVALGAVPVFYASRKLLNSGWIALILAFAYLGNPSNSWIIQELFHPETMAIPFVLAAWCFAEHEKWRWYAAAVVCALLWKEDIALAVAFLGLVVVWRKNRKYALITFFASLGYFFVATRVIIPAILGRTSFYEQTFGNLGSSVPEILRNSIVHPTRLYTKLRVEQAETYAHSILRPYGYVSLLSPFALLIGLPQYFVNLLSILGFTKDPHFHYVAMPLVAATIGAARGIRSRISRWQRWILAAVVLLFTIGIRNTGIGPWSNRFDKGNWPLVESATTPLYERALQLVPDDPEVVTSSLYLVTPHLTHRYEAYTFPNPWRPTYWGIAGENPRDPRRVDFVVLNERALNGDDLTLYQREIMGSGDFTLIFRAQAGEDPIVVWRRTRNGLHPIPPLPAQFIPEVAPAQPTTTPPSTSATPVPPPTNP